MSVRRPWLRAVSLAIALALVGPGIASAAAEYLRVYRTGVDYAQSGNWLQVEIMMRRAIESKPEEDRRLLLRRGTYFPHFYLGLARYHQSDCSGALASWAESENQGAIIGKDEYVQLARLKDDCVKNGAPTLSKAAFSRAATLPKPPEKKTTKEKVRTVQKGVEEGADPARKTLVAVEGAAPEGSKLNKAAGQGQKVVDVAETATDLVDVVLSPEATLEAAIDAYFVGKPARTLDLLQEIDLSDPRAEAQVYLFRAAASFRLHLLEGDDRGHLARARKNANLFQNEQWRDDFPTELFDPRFVRFLRGG